MDSSIYAHVAFVLSVWDITSRNLLRNTIWRVLWNPMEDAVHLLALSGGRNISDLYNEESINCTYHSKRIHIRLPAPDHRRPGHLLISRLLWLQKLGSLLIPREQTANVMLQISPSTAKFRLLV